VADERALHDAMRGFDIVASALSYYYNPAVARAALAAGASYFDLTEDVRTTREVRAIAERARAGQVFMPQCGLAPGFVSVLAYDLTRNFDEVDPIHMRVGALPQFPSNHLKYNLTWSTDGLINEYCNPCEAIVAGETREVLPLEGLEHFSLDGVRYEAFNTSGGLGTMCETLRGKVRQLDYKTIRYLGHRELASFLVHGLRLSERRELLKDILEYSIPITFQDVVIVFCAASGLRRGQLVQVSDARKIYSHPIRGENWSAIQITTAAGICTMIDLFSQGQLGTSGFVRQEQVPLALFVDNRFGRHFQSTVASRFAFSETEQVTP
jgi:saccharopine dehydrogenase-like NADP-dependent oxidoreductase